MAQYELNLRDYWRVLRKRKFIVIFTTVMVGLSSFIFSLSQKPEPLYKASSSVKIERVSSMSGLLVEFFTWNPSIDSLESQALIIKSHIVMEKVAKELGLIDKELSTGDIRYNNEYLNKILELTDMITTEKEGNTNIINIIAITSDPLFSQKLSNTVAEVYRRETIREINKRSTDARKFIEKRLKIMEDRLRKAENKAKEFRERKGLISFDAQASYEFKRLASLEEEYEKIEIEKKEIELIRKQLKNEKLLPEMVFQGIANESMKPIFTKLTSRLLDLRLKRDILLYDMTENNPEITDIKREMNDIIKKMEGQLIAIKMTLETKTDDIKRRIERLRSRFDALPDSELELARLERKVKVNEDIYSQLESKHQEFLIREAEKIENVNIVKPALVPTKPINPASTGTITFAGTLIGFILGVVLAFVYETLDTSIGSIEDVEKLLGIPVLGLIPYTGSNEVKEIMKKLESSNISQEVIEKNARLISHYPPKSPFSESYRSLRTNMQFLTIEEGLKIIAFTSSSAEEGKTICIINLAISIAQTGKRVLLIDADLRKPAIHKVFGLPIDPGFSQIILGSCEWENAIKTVTDILVGEIDMEDIILTPGIDNLHIITSGDIPFNPSELLLSKKTNEFISQIKDKYDVVLFDTPPVLPASDALILGGKIDGVVLVYQVGKIARGVLKRIKVQFDNVKVKIFGTILNGLRAEISPDLHEQYYKYSQYGYEEDIHENISLWSKCSKWLGRYFDKKGPKSEKPYDWTQINPWYKISAVIVTLLFLCLGLWWQNRYAGMDQAIIPKSIMPVSTGSIDGPAENKDMLIILENQDNIKEPIKNEGSKIQKVPSLRKDKPKLAEESIKPSFIPLERRPYTIRVGSFRDRSSAEKVAKDLQQMNYSANYSLVEIHGSSKFYRVFVDSFRTKKEAKDILKKIKSLKQFYSAEIAKLPYTIKLDTARTKKELIPKEKMLIKTGYSPHIVSYKSIDNSGEYFRLQIGAFSNAKEATVVSKRLQKDDIPYKVVIR